MRASRPNEETLRALITPPALARRIYNGRSVGDLEARAMQVLIAVQLLDAPTVKDVAAELALPHKTVSTLLGKLADLGLVSAEADPADQRQKRQAVTRDGRNIVARFAAAAADAIDD